MGYSHQPRYETKAAATRLALRYPMLLSDQAPSTGKKVISWLLLPFSSQPIPQSFSAHDFVLSCVSSVSIFLHTWALPHRPEAFQLSQSHLKISFVGFSCQLCSKKLIIWKLSFNVRDRASLSGSFQRPPWIDRAQLLIRHWLLSKTELYRMEGYQYTIEEQGETVIFLDWVNPGSPWWSRNLTGLDLVNLIDWMEWTWNRGALRALIL